MKYFFIIMIFVAHVMATAQTNNELSKIKPGDPLPANRFVELAKVANPAVVNIFTTYAVKGRRGGLPPGYRDPMYEFFEQFMQQNPYGGPPGGRQGKPAQSLGTGFIIREDGMIVTNNHVIDKADTIKVQLDEKTKEEYEAKVVGVDPKTDIALLKIEVKKKLPTLKLGTSQDLQVGEWVAAFGNPYGHGHTMTKGIVSAIGRELDDLNLFPFIQTDTSINPGNSGGPLVNLQGHVIGVNTAIDARAQGIGFAIPIDNVKTILAQLEKEGKVRRGFVGVYMADIDEDAAQSIGLKQKEGALITQVLPNSPAEKAGLKPYDLMVEFDGLKIKNTHDLARAVAGTSIGKEVSVKAYRKSKSMAFKMKVGEGPDAGKGEAPKGKKYNGQSAPGNMGFKVADDSEKLAEEFGLPELEEARPVVVEVDAGSPAARAGMAPGDVILEVNQDPIVTTTDVLKKLRPGKTNSLRIIKQGREGIIFIRPMVTK